MINKTEKQILIKMMANLDDIKGVMTEEQKEYCKKCFEKINSAYWLILEGIPEEEEEKKNDSSTLKG